MHLTSSPIDWYAARAGGVVAYVLLTIGVLLGLSMSSRRRLPRWPRVALEDLHRHAGLLTGTFVTIHVLTIAIDSYLPFSLPSLIVPFIAHYRPLWTGIGIVAAELLIALAITNRLRTRRLSYRAWRRIHYLNFAVWIGATVHGLGSGTDRSTVWLLAIEAIAIVSVVTLTGWRILRGHAGGGRIAVSVPAAVGVAAAVAAVAVASGPLRFHRPPWNEARFTESLDGRIVRQNGSTRGLVSMAGQGAGTQRVLVRADLLVAAQRMVSTSFAMEYMPSGMTCRGHVPSVDADGLGFEALCRTADGRTRSISARWLDAQGAALQGGTITSS